MLDRADYQQRGSAARADATILFKPGVTDPTAQSVIEAARDLGLHLESVATFRRYGLNTRAAGGLSADRDTLYRKVLANDAIERVIEGPLRLEHLTFDSRLRISAW